MEQVQSFLPQMAQANEKLRKEMAAVPPGHFNIENIDTLGKVMQMVMALFEMNQSDSKKMTVPKRIHKTVQRTVQNLRMKMIAPLLKVKSPLIQLSFLIQKMEKAK